MCTQNSICPSEWLPYAQLVATLLVAGVAGFFAYLPYRVARDKLRLELYQKRFGIYRDFIRFVANYTNDPKPPLSTDFHWVIDEAEFLMPDIAPYLKNIRSKAFDLYVVQRHLNAHNASSRDDHSELVEKERVLLTGLISEITEDKAKPMFAKYLSFPEKRILGIF